MAKRAFTMFVMGNMVTPSSSHTCGGGFVLLAWVEVCALLSTFSSLVLRSENQQSPSVAEGLPFLSKNT
jgi:hypothetical protein